MESKYENIIEYDISIDGASWVIDTHDLRVEKLFGTSILPLPYTPQRSYDDVITQLETRGDCSCAAVPPKYYID